MLPSGFAPAWPCPPNVGAWVTTRAGGVSQPPFASLNLGDHVGDNPGDVAENRKRVTALLPGTPRWLQQVHGIEICRVDSTTQASSVPVADAAVSHRPGQVCAVMTADCLPVLLCDRQGSVVAAAHAGWRGLCAGVIERCVAEMGVPPQTLMAFLGPAIGPTAFEVGGEVRSAFMAHNERAEAAFRSGLEDKWFADIYLLARQRLHDIGVPADAVYGGDRCTVSEPDAFFSYRRDGATGRMAALIWLTPASAIPDTAMASP
ncbi:peptidoglycan editing factor PgeF [Uliginosibacterium sp. H1]|uniref:peptidoglycan editing factor PgeF n=1 Tax=Uliginosibacterium sp. H1 TaxID=3114757 RepID=UPI003FCC39C9